VANQLRRHAEAYALSAHCVLGSVKQPLLLSDMFACHRLLIALFVSERLPVDAPLPNDRQRSCARSFSGIYAGRNCFVYYLLHKSMADFNGGAEDCTFVVICIANSTRIVRRSTDDWVSKTVLKTIHCTLGHTFAKY